MVSVTEDGNVAVSTEAIGTTGEIVKVAEKMLRMLESDITYAPKVLDFAPQFAHLPFYWRYNTVKSAAVTRMWRQAGRQTLAIHPAVAEMSAKASSGRIPLEVLRAIPYMNAMIVYPDPPRFASWRRGLAGNGLYNTFSDEWWERLLGFVTYGSWPNRMPGSPSDADKFKAAPSFVSTTSDPDAEQFGILTISEVLDSQGRFLSFEANTFSLPFDATMTVEEMVEDMMTRFAWLDARAEPESSKRWMIEVLSTVVGTLMYLCSTTIDAEKVPSGATRHLARTTVARKPLSLYRVGWSLGAAITRFRRERQQWEEQHPGTGREQEPQHRRAHFKTVWCGPGRSIPKTVLVSAYWTRRDLLGQEGVNLVHRVPKVG